MAQKSATSKIKEYKKKAELFDSCTKEHKWLKSNFTEVTKALCYFGKLHFDILSLLQDSESETEEDIDTQSSVVGVNPKYLNTLRKHCNISSIISKNEISSEEFTEEIFLNQDNSNDMVGDTAFDEIHGEL